jgi:hypothetical protein
MFICKDVHKAVFIYNVKMSAIIGAPNEETTGGINMI